MRHFRDRAEEVRHRGAVGRARLWAHLIRDLLLSLPTQHARTLGSLLARRRSSGRRASRSPHHPGSAGAALEWLLQDLHYSFRSLRARPAFSALAVGTAAVAVGATTTIFSVVDGVVLRPLPYPDPERLVQVGVAYPGQDRPGSIAPPDFVDWAEGSESFEGLAASRLERRTLLYGPEPRSLEGAGVSGDFFRVLGVEPALGRDFTGGPLGDPDPVAVLQHGFWLEHFGGDPGILGRTVTLEERAFTIVGVLPHDFRPPEAIHHGPVQVWYPLRFVKDSLDDRGAAFLQALGRLRPGIGTDAASQELAAVARSAWERAGVAAGELGVRLVSLHERTVGDAGGRLAVLFGAVGFLLLIGCVNLAGLFLARGSERVRELAIRSALGAGRARIARQLLTESLLAAVIGGALGAALAFGGVALFRAAAPPDIPRLSEVVVDGRILGFAALLSAVAGVLFGAAPALGSTRGDAAAVLRTERAGGTGGRGPGRLRSGLVVVESALAFVLLVAAGLLANSFVRLSRVDPGFDPTGSYYLRVFAPPETTDDASRVAFVSAIRDRLAALPGVEAVGGTNNLPLAGNQSIAGITVEAAPSADARPLDVSYHQVLPGYFASTGIRVLRGRDFVDADETGSPPVALINESFARSYLPSVDPLGARLRFGSADSGDPWFTIVGVVEDVREQELWRSGEPALYLAFRQAPRSGLFFTVRSELRGEALLPAMRSAVWAVDPTLPIEEVGSLRGKMAESLVQPRFYTALLAGFAAVALLLAMAGIYGIVAFAVARRTRELGIRMALGARASRVLAAVIGRGMGLVALGIGLGAAGAVAATRLLASFVYGVTTTDPGTFAATAVVLASVALAACWLPARKILALDPAGTLRTD